MVRLKQNPPMETDTTALYDTLSPSEIRKSEISRNLPSCSSYPLHVAGTSGKTFLVAFALHTPGHLTNGPVIIRARAISSYLATTLRTAFGLVAVPFRVRSRENPRDTSPRPGHMHTHARGRHVTTRPAQFNRVSSSRFGDALRLRTHESRRSGPSVTD